MNTLKTTSEICKILQVRRETLYKWRKDGMPCKHIKGVIRYDPDEVAVWIDSQNEDIVKSEKISGGENNE